MESRLREARRLFELSKELQDKFEESRLRGDIDASIVHGRTALDLLPDGHAWRSYLMDSLGISLYYRYEQWGEMHDLEDSIVLHSEVLDLRLEGHSDLATLLNNLAASLLARFKRIGRDKDLEDVLVLQRSALDLLPEGHPHRTTTLNNLAISLRIRFEKTGSNKDLDNAIAFQRSALDLRPQGHPMRASSLINLANSLLTQFEQHGRDKDLEDAIDLQRSALDLRPEGHPDRALSINNLAISLRTRFEQNGSDNDLEDAIAFQRSALDLLPEGHPLRSLTLNNLANSLLTRFKRTGRDKDVEDALAFQRSALDLRPEGHLHRASSLNNLANSLLTRFDQSGRDKDLDDAIAFRRSALELHPEGHTDRATSLGNLATSLHTRFEQRGRDKDLEDAIELHRASLDLRPEGHPLRASSLNNLANSLLTEFNQSGRDKDLEDVIEFRRLALDLHHEGHTDRAISLNNLAISLRTRFEKTGSNKDLEDAIVLQRSAVDLHPEGHALRSSLLNNLANSLLMRLKQSGTDKVLVDGIWVRRSALDVVSRGHAYLSIGPNHTTDSHSTEFTNDFEEAIQLLRSASVHAYSSLLSRFKAANEWSSLARTRGHATTLEAYQICTSLIERALTLRHDLQSQHDLLVDWDRYGTTPCDASSYAIETGELNRAVELLEQGRGLLWSQMRGYRTRLDGLEGENKVLAIKFMDINHRLEHLATSTVAHMDNSTMANIQEQNPADLDKNLAARRSLSTELQEITEKIREIPGYEDFLRPTAFATLQRAADEGPVIIVNTCKFRSDVLIILPGDIDCVCIELDGKFFDDASELTDQLLTTRREFKPSSPQYEGKLREVMKMLWDRVVYHVVEKLDDLGIQKGSRIWWCPTSFLTALPFHAAGPFTNANGKEKYLLDNYISSYTPTLKSLIDARSGYKKGTPRRLVVEDTNLPMAQAEIDAIRGIGMKPTVLEDASRECVMNELKKTRWVHFTCHGHLNSKPFNCSFELSDGGLTLLDIMTVRPPKAEFAFLSACHSAEQPADSMKDEVLHLAAAMQFCGFRSVIGTMWQLADEDGPAFARDVYSFMGRKLEGVPKFKMAAEALRRAAVRLKGQEGVSAERWVNVVHIGA